MYCFSMTRKFCAPANIVLSVGEPAVGTQSHFISKPFHGNSNATARMFKYPLGYLKLALFASGF